MKKIIKNNILKGAGVLLIAAVMILSTVAVTANTNDQKFLTAANGSDVVIKHSLNSGTTNTRDIIWDNGYPDEINGLCCQRIGSVQLSDVADDFHTTQMWTITGAEWDTADDLDYVWDGTDDLVIYEYTVSGPGAVVIELFDVPNTREYMGELFSRPWYRYWIDLEAEGLEFDLPAGDYYILLRPVTYGSSGQSFWLTSGGNPGSQSEVYFRSDYFGYPDWVPGSTPFGGPYDVNFRIFSGGGGPLIPDLDCDGSLSWTEVEPGAIVTGDFTVENIGDPLSLLDWEIESYPEWGTWTFDPESGEDLTPEDGAVTVEVEVEAPDETETEFSGEIKIVNSEDPDDFCIIDVSLATPQNQQSSLFLRFLDRFPHTFPILRNLLGL